VGPDGRLGWGSACPLSNEDVLKPDIRPKQGWAEGDISFGDLQPQKIITGN